MGNFQGASHISDQMDQKPKKRIHGMRRYKQVLEIASARRRLGPSLRISQDLDSNFARDDIAAFKYRRMRDLNNEASWRCRENRKLRLGSVEADLWRQAEHNLQLKAAVRALETRVARLKHVRNQIASSRQGLGPSLRISPDFVGSSARSSIGGSHQQMRGPIPGLPKLTYHGPRPYH